MSHHTDKQRPGPIRGPVGAARRAGRRVSALTGHEVDGVSAVSPHEDGWRVRVDVVEVPRIPDTTSLMATYEVELDHDGHLIQYERVRRYRRCATDD
ncbi:gas vesicle protein [Streptomyces sp. DSM 44915]|uniref:Gas vesicle protein n=1 Tax=Streptomyces chisholmiae TaxID=3075540 RepID=A0ABU2JLB3_9ACTN|nr:gas vesicle protein [Streptomyces sp. DSM 44915]MDT0265769.1 gas vesicle protein [Streptomyces sp. DSM 44915]